MDGGFGPLLLVAFVAVVFAGVAAFLVAGFVAFVALGVVGVSAVGDRLDRAKRLAREAESDESW